MERFERVGTNTMFYGNIQNRGVQNEGCTLPLHVRARNSMQDVFGVKIFAFKYFPLWHRFLPIRWLLSEFILQA